MLNPRQITRKKSENLIILRETSQPQLKRKKSVSNLVASTKYKKDIEKQFKDDKKQKQEKGIVHSVSKSKITKKSKKSQKNDQNINTLNHKKSVQKLQTIKINHQTKEKLSVEQTYLQRKEQKKSHIHTQQTLTKMNSEAKISTKRSMRKKIEPKQIKQKSHNQNKRNSSQKLCNTNFKKMSKKNSTSKLNSKKSFSTNIKPKKMISAVHHIPKKQLHPKLNKNRISQIIQKSILYQDVNFDFKQQVSLLGSGIKRQEQFFLPYPFSSTRSQQIKSYQNNQKREIENKAAIIIQKHFRGYIQRKYIDEARFIIDSIKTIQRFWRYCLVKKKINKNKEQQQPIESFRGQVSNSLITIRDFNQTVKIQKRNYLQKDQNLRKDNQRQIHNNRLQNNKQKDLKNIVNDLLADKLLNDKYKERILQTINQNNQKHSKKQFRQLFQLQKQRDSINNRNYGKQISQLSFSIVSQQQPKQFYVKNKITMEIDSERYFNSPMNVSNQYMVSPGVKRLTSPKCSSISNSKQSKTCYNNYFKSAKNGNSIFTSPKRMIQQHFRQSLSSQKRLKQHQGIKIDKENDRNIGNQERKSENNNKKTLNRQDYLFDCQIMASNSPILQCKQNSTEDINLLSTQKFNHQTQTRRDTPKTHVITPFPTSYGFIEEFCLIVIDYLRQDKDTMQILLQKLKRLKFYRTQKMFKQWQNLQFEQYGDSNEQFTKMLLKQNCDKPIIFSRQEKKVILNDQPLRLFLNQNDYTDSQVYEQKSSQGSYVRFVFDIFEESMYKCFSHYTIQNLYLSGFRQNNNNEEYLNYVLSESMANMLKCAEMLCGSFQNDDMTEYEKNQKQLINQERLKQMTYQFEEYDKSSCEIWIKMLISKQIYDELIKETLQTILTI